MKLVKGRFPTYAAGNCDFTNGQNKMKPSERVVDMSMNVEDLPLEGALCIHERTVKKMVRLLGWRLTKDVDTSRIAYLEGKIEVLEEQIAKIKEAVPA